MCTASKIDKLEPTLPNPYKLKLDPNLIRDLNEAHEPKCAASKTDRADASLHIPYTLNVEPSLAKDLMERDEPIVHQSTIDIFEPNFKHP
jgi:hypothetical protein